MELERWNNWLFISYLLNHFVLLDSFYTKANLAHTWLIILLFFLWTASHHSTRTPHENDELMMTGKMIKPKAVMSNV